VRFLKEKADKASYAKYRTQVAFFTKHFRGALLDTITAEQVAETIEQHTDTPATRNRYIACIRALLRKAVRWNWLDRAPMLTTYSEPKKRVRWITEEEATALLAALPEWLRGMAQFALATGLRQANVMKLEWAQIDMERRMAWIHAEDAKARKAIGVPLNEDALRAIRGQLGKHLTRVFVDASGKPMEDWPKAARSAWEEACAKVGLEDFRWHDLRHTFASWHVQRGTPLYVLKELGGWNTLAMVEKYAHLSAEHLSQHAERSAFRGTSQSRHSDDSLKVQEVA
jgi:integrase